MDGLQLGMGGGSILDLGDCPHTVFVRLQLSAEWDGGLVQVRNCSVQILDGVQGMGFQVVHRLPNLLKVSDSAFQFCLARPIAPLLVAKVEVIHQQVGQRGFFRLFQSVQKKLLLFVQVCDPALQPESPAPAGTSSSSATMVNREWGHTGQNYLKSLLALGFQAFLIMVCVGIYAVLVQNIAVGDDITVAIWECMGYTVLLCYTLFKTGSLAKSLFGAH